MRAAAPSHEIIGTIEPGDSDELNMKVRMIGSNIVVTKTPRQLYNKEWLQRFSHEDVAYIGFLNASIRSDGQLPIDYFPRKKAQLTESVLIIAILFACTLMLSNMTALRISQISLPWISSVGLHINVPAALMVFPTTYAFGIVLTEVYGYHVTRMVIWAGLATNFLMALCLWGLLQLPNSGTFSIHNEFTQQAYGNFVSQYTRTLIASSVAYLAGEFSNAYILAKLKCLSDGKHGALRLIASTWTSIVIDSVIFCSILLPGLGATRDIALVIAAQIFIKSLYEILLIPLALNFSRYLKIRDGIDYYDFGTNFNPFALGRQS